MDTIWLAEAYPWWRKHQMEARSSTVVSALMAQGDEAADDRLGDHLALDAPSGAGRDGRAGRAGGGRPRPVPARVRDVEDLPEQHQGADEEDARADARCGRDRARRALRRRVRVRRRHLERRRSRALGRGAHAAGRAARLRRRDRAEDAGPRGRDRRRLPHPVDHDACVRPLHARQRGRGHRHRLHGRRVDPRHRSRAGPRRRPRDRRDVPREQGAEHRRRGGHAARPRGDRDGRDPAGRRGDGAGRPARGEGEGHRRRCSTSASRSPARPRTASPRSRSTGTPAART